MEISAIRLEALKEIGNIGAGNAATSLSSMLQTKIMMEVPKVWLVTLKDLSEALGDLAETKATLYLKVEGEAGGKAMFVLSEHSAQVVAKILLSLQDLPDLFRDEMARSALQEVGNILVSSFVTALSLFSGVTLNLSVPALAIDMLGAIIDAVLLDGENVDDNVLIIDTVLSGAEQLEGKFLFIPDEGALDKLLGVFGI